MITVTSLIQTCESCPSQWEGRTNDGRYVYVRYRWGYLSIGIGQTFREAVSRRTADGQNIGPREFGKSIGDSYDGEMTLEQLKSHTAGEFIWPDKAPIGRGTEL
jgi:hypothetical protein